MAIGRTGSPFGYMHFLGEVLGMRRSIRISWHAGVRGSVEGATGKSNPSQYVAECNRMYMFCIFLELEETCNTSSAACERRWTSRG